MKHLKIEAGATFEAPHWDGYSQWCVSSRVGLEAWLCFIAPGQEGAGTTRVFSSQEIQQALFSARLFQEVAAENDRFYQEAKIGATYHYHNGFGEYLRCVVVERDGSTALLPIAMVGAWKAIDLPRRKADGDVVIPHPAANILSQNPFRPTPSLLWEQSTALRARYPDPTQMSPIPLDVPDMTPEQAATAAKWKKIATARALLDKNLDDPDEILSQLASWLS